MRKLTRVLLLCLIAIVYYHSCISYFWHKECIHQKSKQEYMQNHMSEEAEVIYDICRYSKLKYQAEKPGQDYWKAPYETERDGGGDCEDLSVWLLVKLWRMGYDAWLVMGYSDSVAHIWVRIRLSDGRTSRFCDADMTEQFVLEPSYIEVRLTVIEQDKFSEAMARQTKYVKGD